ncbi:hypothetical protein TNCV_353601 [Trichonephila clavipes]|nr:hypothetical protein TNCV_353601 [Trichonephila clavipes]
MKKIRATPATQARFKVLKLSQHREMSEKASALLDCPIASSKEFVTVDDNNVCTTPIITESHLGVFQNSKIMIDADSDNEN